jgi:phospholipid/cholesterol/gamma-HCH transport system substrate-binding protein
MVKKSYNLKVGIFAAVTILLFVGVVMFLSKSEALFSNKITLVATFENTSGLLVGSPVRLAGIDIGTVEDIRFSDDPNSKNVQVILGVDDEYLDRIRTDSIAQMNTKGLLGDMMVNISLGSMQASGLKDGDPIRTKEVQGLSQIVASVETAVSTVKDLTAVVDERVRLVLTEEFAKDIGRIAHSTANLMQEVEQGKGLANALLYDPQMKNDAKQFFADARSTATKVDRAVGRVENVLAEVEKGDGLIHGAIYGGGGKKLFDDLTVASGELTSILREVREGNGIAHTLIYEEDKTNLIQNLEQASLLVKQLAEEVNEGKGTVGGLLKDPTVYRDLKNVLGSVRRNVLLKALVRLTISDDDISRPPSIKQPEKAPDLPAADREEQALKTP